jgi:hypothetical protein
MSYEHIERLVKKIEELLDAVILHLQNKDSLEKKKLSYIKDRYGE